MPRQGPVEPLAKSLSASVKDQTRASSPTSSRGGDEDGDSLDALLEADMPNGTDRASALGLGSRPDTPPTPVQPQHQPPSPELAPLNALPDPQVAAARRAQSDRASTLIGQNLLKGWALLDTQCENESCYAVPLMRRAAPRPKKSDNEDAHKDGAPAPPKAIDPRRYCVICGRDYVREDDVGAYEAFMQAMRGGAAASSQQPAASKNSNRGDAEPEGQVHSAAAKKRRFPSQPSTSAGRTKLASSVSALAALPSSITSKGEGRADTIVVSGLLDEHRTLAVLADVLLPLKASPSPAAGRSLAPAVPAAADVPGAAALLAQSRQMVAPDMSASGRSGHAAAIASLERAAAKVTRRLDALVETDMAVDADPASLAHAADALARVCASLESVRRL
jgi:hypothetical protein